MREESRKLDAREAERTIAPENAALDQPGGLWEIKNIAKNIILLFTQYTKT
ncbi:MAG TPA: hypothetical protein PKN87_08655 [Syntrophomonadaceae bacterium]|nr:hypothetical protein [Syntrophomonadaceae bacterium]HPR93803.1 hypothetical protein [Syntrophomonadaceae bacterium]